MEGQLAVPLHFAVEFLVLVVCIGASFDALRRRRHGAGWWSIGQAGGFALLAVAHGLHGSLIIPDEASMLTAGMRAGGLILLALVSRPALAQVTLTPAGAPMLFAVTTPVGSLFLPGIAAFAVAARGAKAHRADQDPTTFAFAAAFFSFGVAELAGAFDQPSGGWLVAIGHSAIALGSLLLARWLWTSIVRSVRMRFVAAFVVVLTIGVLVVSAALSLVIGNTLEREERKRLTGAAEARLATIQELSSSATGSAQFFSRAEAFREKFASGSDMSSDAQAVAPLTPADFIAFVARDRAVLGSAENIVGATGQRAVRLPTSQEIALAGRRTVGEALAGRSASSVEQVSFAQKDGTKRDQALILGAYPAYKPGSSRSVVGVVVVGYRIDTPFLHRVREDTGAQASLLIGDSLAASTLPRQGAAAAFDAVLPVVTAVRSSGSDGDTTITFGGVRYITVLVPLKSADSQVVGILGLSVKSDVVAAAQRDITRTVFLITLLAVAFAAILAWLSGGRVTKPIRSLTAAAREISIGNYSARTRVTSVDEVGALGSAFNDMASTLERQTGALQTAAATEGILRSRLEAIVDSMADGLIAIDSIGEVILFNRASEGMLRRKGAQAVGMRLPDVLAGTAPDGSSLADAALDGRSTEGTIGGADRLLPVVMTVAPLLNEGGKAEGRVILLRDISSEVAAERMKSEFLSNVSHELRTPITPIRGYAEILSRKKFPREKTEQFLEGILESTERLERIVEILVDFSSIEAGRLKPRNDALMLGEMLDGLVVRWKGRSESHRFVRRGGAGLPPVVGDAKLLTRSINELIDNAVKFSPDGGRIEVIVAEYRNGSRKPTKLMVTVKDRGIGIEPEKMPELFQDFRQGDGSDTRAYGGLGLGLAYVKRIADIHGGDVNVTSTLGRGSEFSIVLPMAPAGVARTAAIAKRKSGVIRRAATKTAKAKAAKAAGRPRPAQKRAAR